MKGGGSFGIDIGNWMSVKGCEWTLWSDCIFKKQGVFGVKTGLKNRRKKCGMIVNIIKLQIIKIFNTVIYLKFIHMRYFFHPNFLSYSW